MTPLVGSPFTQLRKLLTVISLSTILVCSFVLFQSCDFDLPSALITTTTIGTGTTHKHGGWNASELSLETNDYLDGLIRRRNLSGRVEWAAWHIDSTQRQMERSSVTAVSTCFQPRHARVFIPHDDDGDDDITTTTTTTSIVMSPQPRKQMQTWPTLRLPSPRGPRPGEFDASTYLFGVSTTYERLVADDKAMVRSWLWLLADTRRGSNGAHLVVMLSRATTTTAAAAAVTAAATTNDDDDDYDDNTGGKNRVARLLEMTLGDAMAMAVTVHDVVDETLSTTTTTTMRYERLARALRAHGAALAGAGVAKRWFVMLGDAVFIPSLSRLDEKLAALGGGAQGAGIFIGVPDDSGAAQGERLATLATATATTTKDDDGGGGGGGGMAVFSRGGLEKYLSLSCAAGNGTDASSSDDEGSSWTPRAARHWTATMEKCATTEAEPPLVVERILRLDYPIPSSSPVAAAGGGGGGDEAEDNYDEGLESGALVPLTLKRQQQQEQQQQQQQQQQQHGTREPLDLASAYLVAGACGEACFAQRFLFRNNWVLVNGVSVSHYQYPVKKGWLRHGFTNGGSGSGSGRSRSSARHVWTHLESRVDERGVVWQAYVRRAVTSRRLVEASKEKLKTETEPDSVILMIWNDGKEEAS